MNAVRTREADSIHPHGLETEAHVQTAKTSQSHATASASNQTQHLENTLSQGDAALSTRHDPSSPTDGARQATDGWMDPGYAMQQASALYNDPDYKDTVDLLNKAQQLEVGQGLYLIDREFGGFLGSGKNDGKIDRGNVEAAADDPCAPGHAAAKMLMENPRLFALIDADSDGLISMTELHAFIDKMKAQKQSMEDGHGLKTHSGSSNVVTGNPTQATSAAPSTKACPTTPCSTPPPGESSLNSVLSSRGGLEGATENLNNALSSCEDEMSRLSAQMAATDDPKEQAALQNKMNALERRMQTLSAMYQELLTLMSNVSKMQSDIAMTFIRNMH